MKAVQRIEIELDVGQRGAAVGANDATAQVVVPVRLSSVTVPRVR
jgi:hypothetical protein